MGFVKSIIWAIRLVETGPIVYNKSVWYNKAIKQQKG